MRKIRRVTVRLGYSTSNTRPAGDKQYATIEVTDEDSGLTRTIEIDNGPMLAYQAHDRRAIRWVPEVVDLAWDSGLLCSCDVTGHRIRKDGSVGQVRDYHRFAVRDGVVQQLPGRHYPLDWLQAIVD